MHPHMQSKKKKKSPKNSKLKCSEQSMSLQLLKILNIMEWFLDQKIWADFVENQ